VTLLLLVGVPALVSSVLAVWSMCLDPLDRLGDVLARASQVLMVPAFLWLAWTLLAESGPL